MRLEREPILEPEESKGKEIEEKEIKEVVDKIERVYEENKEELSAKKTWGDILEFVEEKILPQIP